MDSLRRHRGGVRQLDQASSQTHSVFRASVWAPVCASAITPRGFCEDAGERERVEVQHARQQSELNVRCVRQFSYSLSGQVVPGLKLSAILEPARFVVGAHRQTPRVQGFHPTVGLLCDAVLEDTFERLLIHEQEQAGHGQEPLPSPGKMHGRAPDHSAEHAPHLASPAALSSLASPAALSTLFEVKQEGARAGARYLAIETPRRAMRGSPRQGSPGGGTSSHVPANVWSPGGAGFLPARRISTSNNVSPQTSGDLALHLVRRDVRTRVALQNAEVTRSATGGEAPWQPSPAPKLRSSPAKRQSRTAFAGAALTQRQPSVSPRTPVSPRSKGGGWTPRSPTSKSSRIRPWSGDHQVYNQSGFVYATDQGPLSEAFYNHRGFPWRGVTPRLRPPPPLAK